MSVPAVMNQMVTRVMSMSGSYPRKSVSNFIITLYAKLYQIVIETNLICDVIIINNKIRHNSFTIFTTRRVLHTEPYFLQNIFILSVWPLRGHLAARGVNIYFCPPKDVPRRQTTASICTRATMVFFYQTIKSLNK